METPDSWLRAENCSIDEFIDQVSVQSSIDSYPHADRIEKGAVVYDSIALRASTSTPQVIASEIADVLLNGPGIAVFAGAFEADVVERASVVFHQIIDAEKAAGVASGDHFAKAGANDRVWNALEKMALRDPGTFADYYANDIVALASTAWLGPAYQVTSQVNVVNPGGQAQEPHRDYHLGFMENSMAESFPAHVHRLSPVMTLQGAIAHCDMPLETGPTMYLPHSQKYEAGYLAWRLPEFKAYFAEHHVQLPLQTGDAVFFNPALFHGAGTNRTANVRRMANLLQVGSALGRTLERVDRRAMVKVLYPILQARIAAGIDPDGLKRIVSASAEGYAFPCNLDVDQPIDGLTPPSDADLVYLALDQNWSAEQLAARLR
ncbi:MAG: ectoine hydroxylase-related dioxygenase (phytanoyl-CoA dioxygenase family) [Ilumatobacter sp.]|jgi:ectoine hydroxylase-related dioxygenase (phytanoyl-CoA dioxygenase family)